MDNLQKNMTTTDVRGLHKNPEYGALSKQARPFLRQQKTGGGWGPGGSEGIGEGGRFDLLPWRIIDRILRGKEPKPDQPSPGDPPHRLLPIPDGPWHGYPNRRPEMPNWPGQPLPWHGMDPNRRPPRRPEIGPWGPPQSPEDLRPPRWREFPEPVRPPRWWPFPEDLRPPRWREFPETRREWYGPVRMRR